MTRRAYRPTDKDRQEVETMAGLGMNHKQIGLIKGITEKTLTKYYRAELELGAAKATLRVSQRLYELATRQNASAAACIFWLKTQAGWREPAGPAAIGKKEQAEIDAHQAEAGTEWAGLLN